MVNQSILLQGIVNSRNQNIIDCMVTSCLSGLTQYLTIIIVRPIGPVSTGSQRNVCSSTIILYTSDLNCY